ncbi:MAG: hypothetical protein JW904_03615 [Spirochaetales bacterium]|nr:hypothetical protein [Spirochaetales bacterium]
MYKRKTYVINKEFQYGLIATFLIIVVCSLLLFSVGFVAYYLVSDLAGERVFDEFIEIKRQVQISIQPLTDKDIKAPLELAAKIVKPAKDDVLSAYILENLPGRNVKLLENFVADKDAFEAGRELKASLNIFLENLIRRSVRLYSEERFTGIAIPENVKALIDAKIDPQTQAGYNLNLQLLGIAYSKELGVTLSNDANDLFPLEFQKVEPAVKRYELVLPPVIINNLLLMVIIIIVGIFYSHRIAGPIYRIEEDIKRVLDGEKNVSIKLRKNDKLKSLADQINKLIKAVEKGRGK